MDQIDPYATPLRTGLALVQEVWDGLVYRDPDSFLFRPLLATSWRAPDPLTLEFSLRPNVWFHDGSPFGPEDVLATVARILRGEQVAIASNYAWLAGAERSGEEAVRLHLAHPFPGALEFVAGVLPILPRHAPPGAGVGTGPWRLVRHDRWTGRIDLARNEVLSRANPKGMARIGRLSIDQPDDPVRPYNDLVSGRVDWIWQLTPAQFTAIGQAPELDALRADSMRVAYLALDAERRMEPGGPLTQLPVRQAIFHAIDRTGLALRFVPGGARVIDTPCYPTQYGCDAAAATRYDYDPATARRLLAQAGTEEGFATRLVTYSGLDLAHAVADDLAKVGVAASVEAVAAAEALGRIEAGQAPLFLGSWGSSSINDMAAFLPAFFGGGPRDMTGLPKLASLVARAGAQADPDRARALYAEAIGQITGQAVWLPLFIDAATYGISRRLAFHPTPDELPRFYRMAWR